MSNQRGFSLIELLIVVAIIGIIAAIAIPNFTQSRIAANEAAAIAAVRTICTAQITYSATYGNGVYAASATILGQCNLIDSNIASAAGRNGYSFTSVGTTSGTFTVQGSPTSAATGRRVFTTDESGILYADSTVLGAGS